MIYDEGKQSFGETQYRLPVSLSAMNILGLDQYQALFLHVGSVVDRNRREKFARICVTTAEEKA